jgi:hypothetical protein
MPSKLTPLLELIVLRWQTDVSKEEAEEINVMLQKEFGTNEAPDTKQKVRGYLCSGTNIITNKSSVEEMSLQEISLAFF